MDIYLWMEDFDDDTLPEYDRNEQLREAVLIYNDEYKTDHKPDVKVRNYFSWKRDKYKPDM